MALRKAFHLVLKPGRGKGTGLVGENNKKKKEEDIVVAPKRER